MKNIRIILFIIFLCIVNSNGQTKKSTIVEADGYAFLSENKTIKDIRREALLNAKREALEKAKTYIKSFSKVKNYELTEDVIKSSSDGFVTIIESKDIGITDKNRYHYWIKAEIEYDLDFIKEQTINKDKPLSLKVWTSQKEYSNNDRIVIFFNGNKDFYANILYQDASGQLFQILPNQFQPENFFKGNQTYQIPSTNDNFELIVTEPFGIEKIIVYASNSEIGEANVSKYGKYFYQLETTAKNYAKQTRGLKIKRKEISDFFESEISIKTIN